MLFEKKTDIVEVFARLPRRLTGMSLSFRRASGAGCHISNAHEFQAIEKPNV